MFGLWWLTVFWFRSSNGSGAEKEFGVCGISADTAVTRWMGNQNGSERCFVFCQSAAENFIVC